MMKHRANNTRAFLMKADWIRSMRDVCAAAGVPFFFKQWGDHDAAGSRGLAVVAYCALNVVEFLFSKEDRTLVSLIGNVAMDIFKFVAAAGAGVLAGAIVGTVTTIVAAPVVVAIFVGVLAGYALNRTDRRIQLTESLVRTLEGAANKTMSPIHRVVHEINRWERWLVEKTMYNWP